jgi:hypothetical protein
MRIKISPHGDLYTAEATSPDRTWSSPHPMPSDDLARELLAFGCSPLEIARALREAGVYSYSGYYHGLAERAAPRVQAALAGERGIPTQKPFAEAWLAYSLFYYRRPLSLEDVIESADAIEHAIPNRDEIAWAFVSLKKRGWLQLQADSYGLTAEGRREIEAIIDQGERSSPVMRLSEWILANPPPS